jgi:peptide/nickel transport system ATP-binding protein
MAPSQPSLLEIRDLSVTLPLARGRLEAVRKISLTLERGEALGIVGESGSGKSMTSLALMGLLPKRAIRTASVLRLGQRDLLTMPDRDFARDIAGKRMAMIFQEPMTALNPVYTVGRQITEMMTANNSVSRSEVRERAISLLEMTGVPAAKSRLDQYPHQLSGGLRQRIMIAMMLMNEPDLLIADEPTTALDVTIQAQILCTLADLRRKLGMALILITHDLGVVSRTVDKVAVMYAGEIVESGPIVDVLENPQHPYTRGLLASMPSAARIARDERLASIKGIVPSLIGPPPGCAFAKRCPDAEPICFVTPPPRQSAGATHHYRCVLPPRGFNTIVSFPLHNGARHPAPSGTVLSARNVSCTFQVRSGLFGATSPLVAVDNVSLDLEQGQVLALVGESGCGKSTLARVLLGIQSSDSGEVRIDGEAVLSLSPLERARRVQPVFQDPYSSLNPRKTLGQSIMRPLEIHGVGTAAERQKTLEATMDLVGLPRRLMHSYPGQVSGGQRQRVAIARAIILRPRILICDEPTSALDVSVQSQILNLLLDLSAELGLSYLIITHDLSVVDYVATRVAVMYLGQIVEHGDKRSIIDAPKHPYTQALLSSVLALEPGAPIPPSKIGAGFPNPLQIPSGCRFHPRCPELFEPCSVRAPELLASGTGEVRCLLYDHNPSQQVPAFASHPCMAVES